MKKDGVWVKDLDSSASLNEYIVSKYQEYHIDL